MEPPLVPAPLNPATALGWHQGKAAGPVMLMSASFLLGSVAFIACAMRRRDGSKFRQFDRERSKGSPQRCAKDDSSDAPNPRTQDAKEENEDEEASGAPGNPRRR
eukprot:2362651-Prymnesium_polylepis.1